MLRDACLTWPARVGRNSRRTSVSSRPRSVIALEDLVRAHLEELASERSDF